jgi:mRNA m6A methyltransferase catalytic subunit
MKEAEDVSEVSSFKTKKMDHFLDDQDYKLEEADGLDELDDLGDDELADDIDAIKTKREYDEDVA